MENNLQIKSQDNSDKNSKTKLKNLIQHQEIHTKMKVSKFIKCKNIKININLNILQNLLEMHK